jgi:hypothetical protein
MWGGERDEAHRVRPPCLIIAPVALFSSDTVLCFIDDGRFSDREAAPAGYTRHLLYVFTQLLR